MTRVAAGRIEGELSLATVAEVLRHSGELLREPVLDLSAVTRADSAGVALLLELHRRSRGRLELRQVPPQLAGLIRFFELEPVLMPAKEQV